MFHQGDKRDLRRGSSSLPLAISCVSASQFFKKNKNQFMVFIMPRFRGDCSSDYLADKPNKPCPLLKKKKKRKDQPFF